MKRAAAIIVAAGQSRRMGFDKMTAALAGKPVLWHSLQAFQESECISDIVLVADGKAASLGRVWMEEGVFPKLSDVRAGGGERWISVRIGLEALKESHKWVAVHDGARPLITPKQISRCLGALEDGCGAVLARAITETMKRTDSYGFVVESIDRDRAWLMETPQVVPVKVLRDAFRKCGETAQIPTDEVSAVQATGCAVRVVKNDEPNVKITYPGDLVFAERWLENLRISTCEKESSG